MNLKSLFRTLTAGLMLGGLGLSAQEASAPFAVGLHLISGLDGLKNITNNSSGAIVDFSYQGSLAKTDVPYRAGLAFASFPGSSKDGVKTSLTSVQLFGDIIIRTQVEHLNLITGLSLNKYSQKKTLDASADPSLGLPTDKGIKFGARLGIEYAFNRSWSSELMVQMTELGVQNRPNPTSDDPANIGAYGANPSWVQVGVKWHF